MPDLQNVLKGKGGLLHFQGCFIGFVHIGKGYIILIMMARAQILFHDLCVHARRQVYA